MQCLVAGGVFRGLAEVEQVAEVALVGGEAGSVRAEGLDLPPMDQVHNGACTTHKIVLQP